MEKRFAERLAELRTQKGVSARDMSLSIGQSAGYINNIENRNNMPSMTGFFYICEYLGITPMEFFDYEVHDPNMLNDIVADLRDLSPERLKNISAVIKDLKR